MMEQEILCGTLLVIGIFFFGLEVSCGPFDNRSFFLLDKVEKYQLTAVVGTLLLQTWVNVSGECVALRDPFWRKVTTNCLGCVIICLHLNFWIVAFGGLTNRAKRFLSCFEEGMIIVRPDGFDMKHLNLKERAFFGMILKELFEIYVDEDSVFHYPVFSNALRNCCVSVLHTKLRGPTGFGGFVNRLSIPRLVSDLSARWNSSQEWKTSQETQGHFPTRQQTGLKIPSRGNTTQDEGPHEVTSRTEQEVRIMSEFTGESRDRISGTTLTVDEFYMALLQCRGSLIQHHELKALDDEANELGSFSPFGAEEIQDYEGGWDWTPRSQWSSQDSSESPPRATASASALLVVERPHEVPRLALQEKERELPCQPRSPVNSARTVGSRDETKMKATFKQALPFHMEEEVAAAEWQQKDLVDRRVGLLELRLHSELVKQEHLQSEMAALKEQQERKTRIHKLQLMRLQEHIEKQERELAEMRGQMSQRSIDSEAHPVMQNRPHDPRQGPGDAVAPSPSRVAEAFAEGPANRLKKSRSAILEVGTPRVQESGMKQHLGRQESYWKLDQQDATAQKATVKEKALRWSVGDSRQASQPASPGSGCPTMDPGHLLEHPNELRKEADVAWARVKKMEVQHAMLCKEIQNLHGVIDDVRVAWRSRTHASSGLCGGAWGHPLVPLPPLSPALVPSLERESFGVLL